MSFLPVFFHGLGKASQGQGVWLWVTSGKIGSGEALEGSFMKHAILILVGGIYLLTAVFMFVVPQAFYDTTPGVSMMGPFNVHFIRDAALAFLVSGSALVWGASKRDRTAAIIGAAWPAMHAAFHIWLWVARGVPLDQVAFVNAFGIQLPAWLALASAVRLKETRRHG